MCGISGIVSARGPASAEELGRMTSLIEYRGPDDFGYLGYSSRSGKVRFTRDTGELAPGGGQEYDLLLGHRRLAILDLSEQGRCPMPSADRRLWITYNGEIYNYLELRAELAALGHRFTTGTDTEVILAAYRQWGTGCLDRFNGMWSFALLDVDKSILFCARDRLGVKPFYYHWDGRTFSFGSEIKQLLCLPRVTAEAHPGVLFDFLVFSVYGCNSEQTFFRDVMDMRGGHYLVVPLGSLQGWVPKPVQWWSIDLRNKLEGLSDRQYADRYREIFEDAVRLRLRSDVPVGSCLSGGLDSSGIVCVVDRLLKNAGVAGLQKTFTSVSDNPRFDEREYAQAVIDATRVEPSFVNPSPERLLADLDRLMWHQDEPFISTSIFAGWCVYGLVREKGVTVTLDGQGPDEMLGGYVPSMYPALLVDNLVTLELGAAFRNVRGLHQRRGLPYKRIATDLVRELGAGRLPRSLMPSLRRARALLAPEFLAVGLEKSIALRRIDGHGDWCRRVGGTPFDRELLQATVYDSLPGILRQVDRNSMAFSIEARLPFLDYRLVEYTFSLPTRQKIEDGLSKQVYRRALDGILPDVIRDRLNKLGFVTAEEDWLREGSNGAFARVYADIPPGAPYSRGYVQQLFSGFVSGRQGYDPLLWKVFNLERLRALGGFSLTGAATPVAGATASPARRRVRTCVISPGVVHAVPRTVAMVPHLDEVHFIDMTGTANQRALEERGVIYHVLTGDGGSPFTSVRLRRLLARIRPDVICCHYGLGDHFFNVIAANCCPVAVIAMGTDVLHATGDMHLSPLVRLLSRMGLRRAESISAKSHFLAAELGQMGVAAPVDVNYWGCDLRRFTPGDRAAARARLGLPAGAKVILSPRALEPRLNIHLIVEAFPAVLARWPDALLVILGRADPEYEAAIVAAVARLGLDARVRFLGLLEEAALPDYYRASDLVVSMASSEGFPNTLLEVMACGVPVLVGDIPQIRELLTDGVDARICPIEVGAIAAGMLDLLADPAGAARQVAAGREVALEFGDIGRNAQRWAERLRELAVAGKPQATLSIWRYRLVLRAYQVARALHIPVD
ncbi:MAG: asparagine synthase (glutamine-hydrolyzing) [Chromatiales bacterium]|nr:asparagine synthase (glutamine-hydrolyzing) [Chromatiales bacterium]